MIFLLLMVQIVFDKMSILCTGLFGFHDIVITVWKTSFSKSAPNDFHLWDYTKFSAEVFKDELKLQLINVVKSFEILWNFRRYTLTYSINMLLTKQRSSWLTKFHIQEISKFQVPFKKFKKNNHKKTSKN